MPPHVKTTAADTKTDENDPAPTEAATDTVALTDTQMLTDTRALPGGETPPGSNAASDAGGAFRPMLQVDHFAWPKVCRQLDRAADDELNHLADALVAAMARGERVLALGGCRLGEGATTMLLCCSHRLAERGFQVVMVDANLADPQLAKRLGLLPQFGWEEVLAGRLPLEEVIIESTRSRLAILPLREAFAGTGGPTDDENRPAESINTLAAHYDLVLVDLGSLEDPEVVGGPLARGIASRLDAIVLVHNVHTTPQNHLDELQRHLAAANLTQMGVVQNFVRV